jgi:hypothetical protein
MNSLNNLDFDIDKWKNYFNYENININNFKKKTINNKIINNIVKLLLNIYYLDKLSEPFNETIFNELRDKIKTIDNNILNPIYYYIYLTKSNILENIHWSYLSISYLLIFFKKIENINKIINIINWNHIYNNEYLNFVCENLNIYKLNKLIKKKKI